MPPKKKDQKGISETYYKPKKEKKKENKRKVISPLQCEPISRTKDCSDQPNVKHNTQPNFNVSPESNIQTQTKRFHASAPVGVQQTKAVLQKRRDMNEIYEREKAAGKTLKWAGAKLLARDGNTGDFKEITQ